MSERQYRSNDEGRAPGRRLYRDRDNSCCFGVCAGIADFFGFDITLIRVITAIGAFLFFPTVLIGYFVLALLLPKKPKALPGRSDKYSESVQRQVRSSPHSTLDGTRRRFRELDVRLQRLEKYLTSKRFNLDKEFETLRDSD